MAASPSNRTLITILAASNSLLLAKLLYPTAKTLLLSLRSQLRRLFGKKTGDPLTPELLGQDYVPPLPKPIAEALERSCLCFLATAGSTLEPHLSLMRFTYCRGLD